jgi:hypothetical protein
MLCMKIVIFLKFVKCFCKEKYINYDMTLIILWVGRPAAAASDLSMKLLSISLNK